MNQILETLQHMTGLEFTSTEDRSYVIASIPTSAAGRFSKRYGGGGTPVDALSRLLLNLTRRESELAAE
jgi:hypothetical protein